MKRVFIILFLFLNINSFSQELINNGAFVNGDNWTTSSAWSISSGTANYDASDILAISQSDANMVSSIKANTTYTLGFTLSNSTGRPYLMIRSTDGVQYIAAIGYDLGSYSLEFTTPSDIGAKGISILAWTDCSFSIDDISLTENSAIGESPYWVHPDGSDSNAGDSLHPWATWQKGFNEAQAGDTVWIRGGVYYGTGQTTLDSVNGYGHNGTASNYIYFMAYPGETPILDLSQYTPEANYNRGIFIQYTTYIYFKGLTVRNVWQRHSGVTAQGIEAYGCSNLIFDRCTVHNIGGRGIGFFGGFGNHNIDERIPDVPTDTVKYINCDVYNVCDSLCNDPLNCETATPGGIADAFKFDNTEGSYISFEGCRAWHYSDNGIDVSSSVRAYINRCWMWNNSEWIFEGFQGEVGGMKYGALRDSITTVTRTITNCISACNSWLGFDENNSGDAYYPINLEFYNNLSYANWRALGNFSYRTDPATVYNNKYKNNLSYKDTTGARANEAGDIIEAYNSWVTDQYNSPPIESEDAFTITDADFVSLDTAQLRGTRQADGSLPVITFGHLAATSDLINAGVDVGLTYDGTAPEIGAFEYDEGLIAPLVATGLQTALTIRRATARGTVTSDGGADITQRGFVYSTSENPTTDDNKVIVAGTTGAFTATLTGLQSNTTYYVKAYASNSEGTGYGEQVIVITKSMSAVSSPSGNPIVQNGKVIINR